MVSLLEFSLEFSVTIINNFGGKNGTFGRKMGFSEKRGTCTLRKMAMFIFSGCPSGFCSQDSSYVKTGDYVVYKYIARYNVSLVKILKWVLTL